MTCVKSLSFHFPPASEDTTLLKLIACASMLIDHIGKGFLPYATILQIIGRLAFPLFAYCLVIGLERTSNFQKYLSRLLFLALITQPFYMAFFQTHRLNVLFTLSLGLVSLWFVKHNRWYCYILLVAASALLPIEYGFAGVMLPLAFTLLRYDSKYLYIAAAFMVLAFPVGIQTFSLLSLPLILYSGNNPLPFKVDKRFFYLFYPVHLATLLVFRLL